MHFQNNSIKRITERNTINKDSLKPQSDSALACAISGLVYLLDRLDKATKKRL
jgi:hypothetical protein